jgi:hypothetical protein
MFLSETEDAVYMKLARELAGDQFIMKMIMQDFAGCSGVVPVLKEMKDTWISGGWQIISLKLIL